MDKSDKKLDKLMTDRESSTVGENSTPQQNCRDNTSNLPNPNEEHQDRCPKL